MQVKERSRMPDFRAVLRRGIAVGCSQCAGGDSKIVLMAMLIFSSIAETARTWHIR
jgi:hypothetical protein